MKTKIILSAAAAVGAASLVIVSASIGANSATPALRGVVGPSFTIKLTKAGKVVRSLKAGTYKVTVSDRSSAHNFVLQRQGGAARQLTSVPFVGTRTFTLKLTRGVWKFYCAPHAAAMVGRVTVGGATPASRATTTTTTTVADDHGGHGEPEPGDDHGGHSGYDG